jgi:hypothetical protein
LLGTEAFDSFADDRWDAGERIAEKLCRCHASTLRSPPVQGNRLSSQDSGDPIAQSVLVDPNVSTDYSADRASRGQIIALPAIATYFPGGLDSVET